MTVFTNHVRNLVPAMSERAMSDRGFECATLGFMATLSDEAGPNEPRPEPGSGRVRRSYV